jgi:Ser/Thr protein kinase RdoA (MazF antagonist)
MLFDPFDSPRPDISPVEASETLGDIYGIHGLATPLSGERDRTFRIDVDGVANYVFKFGNAADTPDALAAQAGAIEHALAADPSLPLPSIIVTTDGSAPGR